jgi:peptidyl-tRNA hydrolase, PTH1 family
MKILFGLGNPEEKYLNNRHNVGFKFIDYILDRYGFSKLELNKKLQCALSTGMINGEKYILVKPLTYMNLSGDCVQKVVSYYKVDTDDITIIFDDINISLGSVRYRLSGSSGGQNGMKSIINILKTENIRRLRIGIKGLNYRDNLHSYVLSDFNKEEKEVLPKIFTELISKIDKDDLKDNTTISIMSA